jgi:hypothetical protein
MNIYREDPMDTILPPDNELEHNIVNIQLDSRGPTKRLSSMVEEDDILNDVTKFEVEYSQTPEPDSLNMLKV